MPPPLRPGARNISSTAVVIRPGSSTLPRAGSWDRNLTAAERVADRLQPHASDPLGLQVLGMITLTASLAAASVQRGDTAQHWLTEATDIASHLRGSQRSSIQRCHSHRDASVEYVFDIHG